MHIIWAVDSWNNMRAEKMFNYLKNIVLRNLQKKVFERCPSLKPSLYIRCVDDNFVVIDDMSGIKAIKKNSRRIYVTVHSCT